MRDGEHRGADRAKEPLGPSSGLHPSTQRSSWCKVGTRRLNWLEKQAERGFQGGGR